MTTPTIEPTMKTPVTRSEFQNDVSDFRRSRF